MSPGRSLLVAFALLAPAAAGAAVVGACSTKAKLIGQGGTCLQATDCEDGLVCVPQKDGTSICDNDLTSVQKTEDAQAPARDAGGDGAADGAATDGGEPPDTGPAPDVQQPPPDSGSGTDAATD